MLNMLKSTNNNKQKDMAFMFLDITISIFFVHVIIFPHLFVKKQNTHNMIPLVK